MHSDMSWLILMAAFFLKSVLVWTNYDEIHTFVNPASVMRIGHVEGKKWSRGINWSIYLNSHGYSHY